MKPPPLVPLSLRRFLVAGLLVSFAATAAAWFAEPYIADQWLQTVDSPRELAELVLTACGIVVLGVTALWGGLYLAWWPVLFLRYRAAQRAAEASRGPPYQMQPRSPEVLMAEFRREQRIKSYLKQREPWERQHDEPYPSWTARTAAGEAAFADRLKAAETAVMKAYTRHALATDFLGRKSEQDHLSAFADRLPGLGIADLGTLHASKNPTIQELLKYAAEVPRITPQTLTPDHRLDPLAGPFIKRYISG